MVIRTPEKPAENPGENLAEIAKLTPQESVVALTEKLEHKSEGMSDLVKNQKDERKKEVVLTAQTSVDGRLELIHSMA